MSRMQVQVWYTRVMDNLGLLPDAITYYEQVIKDGERYLVPKGNLENLLLGQAGLTYFYETAYNDAKKIAKWLEMKLSHEKAKTYRWLQSTEGRAKYGDLKATDLKQYVEADNDVYDMVETYGYIDSIRMSLESLIEGLTKRGIYLSLTAKIRAAGLTEIMVDGGQEDAIEE